MKKGTKFGERKSDLIYSMALVFLKKNPEIGNDEKEEIQQSLRETEFKNRQITRLLNHTALFYTGEEEHINRQGLLRLRSKFDSMQIDVISIPEYFFIQPPKLVFFDMDSTVIQEEVIDELARENGVFEKVASVTKEAMEGGIPFDEALRKRVQLLAGLPESTFSKVANRLNLNAGMDSLFAKLPQYGCKIVILSGGFVPILQLFAEKFPVSEYWANSLEVQNGKLTGEILGTIVNSKRKSELVLEICYRENVDPKQVVAVGDGANDALMLQTAGMGIGYHAKQGLKDKIDQWVDHCDLDALLFLFHDKLSL